MIKLEVSMKSYNMCAVILNGKFVIISRLESYKQYHYVNNYVHLKKFKINILKTSSWAYLNKISYSIVF